MRRLPPARRTRLLFVPPGSCPRVKQRSCGKRSMRSPRSSPPKPARRMCATTPRPKTFITSSNSSSPNASARSASSSTPAAAATNRSRPTCASMSARKSNSRSTASPRGHCARRASAKGRRSRHAQLHAPAARRTCARRALAPRLRRNGAARCLAPAPIAPTRLNFCPLGSGAVAGATLALDRTIAATRARLHRAHRQFHRRHQRSRLHSRVFASAHVRRPAPEPLCRRDHALRHCRVRICRICPKPFLPARAPCRRRRIPI